MCTTQRPPSYSHCVAIVYCSIFPIVPYNTQVLAVQTKDGMFSQSFGFNLCILLVKSQLKKSR